MSNGPNSIVLSKKKGFYRFKNKVLYMYVYTCLFKYFFNVSVTEVNVNVCIRRCPNKARIAMLARINDAMIARFVPNIELIARMSIKTPF